MRRRVLLLLFALAVVVASVSCARVLGIKQQDRRAFPHHAHAVKGINCRECHTAIASAGEEGQLHIPETAKCLECHKKPHDPNTCSNCHGLPWVRPNAELAKQSLRFDHGKHLQRTHGECVRCHANASRDAEKIRPEMAVCFTCHKQEGAFASFATRDCDQCHTDLKGEHVPPTSHVVHEGDWLREHGARAGSARDLCATCHSERQCAGCHGTKTVPALPEKMAFDDPMRLGVHRAGFKSRHSLEARANPGLCSTCHEQSKFCDTCHADNKLRAADNGKSPHPSGWLGLRGEPNEHGRAAWRDPSVCASCHSGGGERMCVGCHRVGGIGGNPHRPGWTSQKNPKTDVPCNFCHAGP